MPVVSTTTKDCRRGRYLEEDGGVGAGAEGAAVVGGNRGRGVEGDIAGEAGGFDPAVEEGGSV